MPVVNLEDEFALPGKAEAQESTVCRLCKRRGLSAGSSGQERRLHMMGHFFSGVNVVSQELCGYCGMQIREGGCQHPSLTTGRSNTTIKEVRCHYGVSFSLGCVGIYRQEATRQKGYGRPDN
jgi:hypothetical protein